MPKLIDYTGECLDNFQVIRRAYVTNSKQGSINWLCIEDDTEVILSANEVRRRLSKPRLKSLKFKSVNKKLIACKGYYSKHYKSEYATYNAMKQRCFDSSDKRYSNYGARGITICDRWLEFETFLLDMGPKPGFGYSIERIDNNGNYEPSNCKWATAKEQAANKRNIKLDELHVACILAVYQCGGNVAEYCRLHGINKATAYNVTSGRRWQ